MEEPFEQSVKASCGVTTKNEEVTIYSELPVEIPTHIKRNLEEFASVRAHSFQYVVTTPPKKKRLELKEGFVPKKTKGKMGRNQREKQQLPENVHR